MSRRLVNYLIENETFADSPLMVVDVGVRGGFERHWNMFFDQVLLIGFEPDEMECALLQKRWYKSIFFPIALDSVSQRRKLYMTHHPNAMSFYPPIPKVAARFPWSSTMEIQGEKFVQTDTLDNVLRSNNYPAIDYIKLDVEGAELDVLTGASETLKDVIAINTEALFCPVRQGQAIFRNIDDFLSAYGFEVYHITGYRHARRTLSANPFPEGRGQMLWGQILYFRDVAWEIELRPAEWPLMRILKAVAILDSMSFVDVAIEVIQAATKRGIIRDIDAGGYINMLTPLIDGQEVTYEEYMEKMASVIHGHNARDIVASYKENWSGRLG